MISESWDQVLPSMGIGSKTMKQNERSAFASFLAV